ncbi:MAG: guanylate kinase [Chloroflexota bacterium]|nr:guanylate kinase [Chloroflexota bacterium]
MSSPLLIVLSGPSGVGKDAVLSKMRGDGEHYHFTVTATTRAKRPSEHDRVDYIFHSVESFRSMIDKNELLEWAEVYGNFYGVPRDQVRDAMRTGKDVIIKIDVQGAESIKKIAPEAVFIFLMPPNVQDLESRLTRRLSETASTLKLRLMTAQGEMEKASNFDHVIVNHEGLLDDTITELNRVVETERLRIPPRKVSI